MGAAEAFGGAVEPLRRIMVRTATVNGLVVRSRVWEKRPNLEVHVGPSANRSNFFTSSIKCIGTLELHNDTDKELTIDRLPSMRYISNIITFCLTVYVYAPLSRIKS